MNNLENLINKTKKLNLLYIEDNKETVKSILPILEEFFDNITFAIDGEDGYNKYIQQNDINIVISDISMPKLSGLELFKKLKKINMHTHFIFLSAHDETDLFLESILLGVDGFLLKPLDVNLLEKILHKVILEIEEEKEFILNKKLLEHYKEITDKDSIISIIDTKGVITYVNDAFCELSEYSKDELIGRNYNSILTYRQPEDIHIDIWNTIEMEKNTWQGTVKFVSRYGIPYYLKSTIKPILDLDNNIIEYMALRNDVTAIMNPKKQLEDVIKNTEKPLVVYLQLEDFSSLEDIYDISTIEEIQDTIKLFIQNNLPSQYGFDTVYQLGNGDYAIASDINNCLDDTNDFFDTIKKLQKTIKKGTVTTKKVTYDMSAIVSISYSESKVLENAKLGIRKLLTTKQDFIISNNLSAIEANKAKKNIQVLGMVKKAIDNLQIVSYFQPIINNKTQQIEKYESLVRIIDNGDVISPYFFLDTAKKGKYYSKITSIILDNSFRALNQTNMNITINLSAIDIEQESTREKLLKLLNQNKENASRIVFELLEDEDVKDFKVIIDFIDHVKQLGVKIAIDDFGTGYSNFERLLDYKPDIIKIDGSLVKNIISDKFSFNVIETIVDFAKKQNIETVAEYVENEKIFNMLSDLGVDYSQGYYFSEPKPMSAYNNG